jgi:hypothetical protein
MMRTTTACFLSLVVPTIVNATQYNLLKDYSGQTFFDEWNYYGSCEFNFHCLVTSDPHGSRNPVDNLTNGDAMYVHIFFGEMQNNNYPKSFVNASEAASQKLTYVDPVTNNAIIKVDNDTVVPFNGKRNTVRITTQATYGIGSLFVADMV